MRQLIPASAGVATRPSESALPGAAAITSESLKVCWRAGQHDVSSMLRLAALQGDGFPKLASLGQAVYD